MRRRSMSVSRWACVFAVLLLFDAAVCSANLISYSTWPQVRDRLMVIDEDGGNPAQLLVMSKCSFPTGGSISPDGLEETWIVFNDCEDIYKIRPDGSDKTLVLCAPSGDHPLGWGDPIWSPDGSEILVGPYSESEELLALIPADRIAGDTCDSEWTEIYDFTSPWTLDSEPAWNHDGSRIAFTEMDVETELRYVVVLERQPSGAWSSIDPIPLDLPFTPWFLSWRPQPESGLLIFRHRHDTGVLPVTMWLGQFDLENVEDGWSYVLDDGSPIEMHAGSRPKWSPDGNEILYTDPEGDLVVWNYLNGSSRVVGSGTFADWQRDVVVGFCGDLLCAGSETQCSCPEDCGDPPLDEADSCTDLIDNDCDGAIDCEDVDCSGDPVCQAPYCGDGFCDSDEDECTCPGDCGTPPSSEVGLCSDSLDNDCDLNVDCEDTDCVDDPVCSVTCGAVGDPCDSGADCCSGLCHPVKGVCK